MNSITNDKNGKPNGRFTASADIVNVVKDWPVASGFNLFAFNTDGEKNGCYAVVYKQSNAIINRSPNAISGLRDQVKLITGQ